MMHVIGTVIDKYLQIISQIYYNGINTITNYGNSDESGKNVSLQYQIPVSNIKYSLKIHHIGVKIFCFLFEPNVVCN